MFAVTSTYYLKSILVNQQENISYSARSRKVRWLFDASAGRLLSALTLLLLTSKKPSWLKASPVSSSLLQNSPSCLQMQGASFLKSNSTSTSKVVSHGGTNQTSPMLLEALSALSVVLAPWGQSGDLEGWGATCGS